MIDLKILFEIIFLGTLLISGGVYMFIKDEYFKAIALMALLWIILDISDLEKLITALRATGNSS